MIVSWCAKRRPARPDCELRPPSCVDAARGTMAKRKKHRRTSSSPHHPPPPPPEMPIPSLVMADNRPPDLTKWLKEHVAIILSADADSQAQLVDDADSVPQHALRLPARLYAALL